MTEQELWEGLHAVERCEDMDEARTAVRDLLGRMGRDELAVMARAAAMTLTPEDFEAMSPEAMSPEAARLWSWLRRRAIIHGRRHKTLGASLEASGSETNNYKPERPGVRQAGAGSL